MERERWKGKYSYKLDDGSQSITVGFELNIIMSDGSFYGSSTDDEFCKICDIHPTVKGFIDDNIISFLITYPFSYARNDFGELELIKTIKNYQVEYNGNITEADKWNGEWIAVIESYK